MINIHETGERQQLAHEEVRETYPGLPGIVNRVSSVLLRRVAPLLPHADRLRPPILLCDTQALREDIAYEMRDSRREQLDKTGNIVYDISNGCVYLGREYVQQELARGEFGHITLAILTAEEYLHAFSTEGESGNVRTGFMYQEVERKPHGLEPGKMYAYELPFIPRQERDHTVPSFPEDEERLRLTENATKLVIHTMLNELIPADNPRLPFLTFFDIHTGKQLLTTEKTPDIAGNALKSLIMGDKKLLRGILQGKLLRLLQRPNINIASHINLHWKEGEEVYY